MKDFIYRDKHNLGRGFIGTLQHKTLNTFIQVYEKTFYVMGVDSSRLSINKKLLKAIKRIQEGTFQTIVKGDEVQSTQNNTIYIVDKVNSNNTFNLHVKGLKDLVYKNIERKLIKKIS